MKSFVFASVAAAAAALGSPALADFVPGVAFVEPALTGSTQYDGWIGLTSVNYPGYGGFPGTAPWPGAIGSNRAPDNTFNVDEPGDAGLIKVSNGTGGGPYLGAESIYFGGFSGDINNYGGKLAVTDSTPVAGLSNIVFQVQIAEAWTFDFHDGALPVLSYNGGSQQLAATTSLVVEQFFNGTVEMPTGPEDVFINTHLLQWDLTGIGEPITEFRVEFTGVQHAQVHGARLDQSDTYTIVPAPGAVALLGLGTMAALRRRRR